MSYFDLIDDLYGSFARSLRPAQAETALRLSAKLGLVPREGLPWSQVFQHEVVLAAPAIFSEATPDVPSRTVRQATLAHLLGVIHAFASDRLLDEEAEATDELLAFTADLRKARDEATKAVCGTDSPTPRWRDAEAERAIHVERTLLRPTNRAAVPFETYECVSRSKQVAASPGTMELARAAGFSATDMAHVAELLESLALGLQMYDDASDWEKDAAAHGAWAAALIGATHLPLAEARERVRNSTVLPRMIERGCQHFADAERMARAMKASAIATWAAERCDALTQALKEERRAPGYAARRNALTGWALEVLG